jgi:hypothetical protein
MPSSIKNQLLMLSSRKETTIDAFFNKTQLLMPSSRKKQLLMPSSRKKTTIEAFFNKEPTIDAFFKEKKNY